MHTKQHPFLISWHKHSSTQRCPWASATKTTVSVCRFIPTCVFTARETQGMEMAMLFGKTLCVCVLLWCFNGISAPIELLSVVVHENVSLFALVWVMELAVVTKWMLNQMVCYTHYSRISRISKPKECTLMKYNSPVRISCALALVCGSSIGVVR